MHIGSKIELQFLDRFSIKVKPSKVKKHSNGLVCSKLRLTPINAEQSKILQTDKLWTQMILAGNQSKQRGPLHINLKNQDGLCQRQICVILHDRHTDIGACISCNFTPWQHAITWTSIILFTTSIILFTSSIILFTYFNYIIHLFTPSSPTVYQFGAILIVLLSDLW